MSPAAARKLVIGMLIWVTFSTSVVLALNWSHRNGRAVIGMGCGLIVVWIYLCGGLMFWFRDHIRNFFLRCSGHWAVKFVLFTTLLACVEEAVTTSMTNLAPLFGVKVGDAYITASANYLDVIALHSVVVFVPMFVCWALLLWRYDFSPFAVFLLFGLTGTFAESISFGLQNVLQAAFWIFVYGLMIYLPAYCVPIDRPRRSPRWWFYPVAVFLPFLFLPLVPTALVAGILAPHHPKIHFPPISQ